MDWDEGGTTYTTSKFAGNDEEDLGSSGPLPLGEATRQMREFIRTYRGVAGTTQGFILPGVGANACITGDGHSSAHFPYRDQLISRWRKKEPWLEVELGHVNEFSSRLMDGLQIWPVKYLRCFENAAQEVLIQLIGDGADSRSTEMQVILQSDQSPTDLRSITAEHMNRLIKIPGIIIGCHAVQSKARTVNAQCRRCQAVRRLNCEGQFSETRVELPKECPSGGSECGSQPFAVLLDECTFSDQQSIKLQESPEMVPTGGMPRHVRVVVDRALVDRVSPGSRVCVVGVPSLQVSYAHSSSSPFDRLYVQPAPDVRNLHTVTFFCRYAKKAQKIIGVSLELELYISVVLGYNWKRMALVVRGFLSHQQKKRCFFASVECPTCMKHWQMQWHPVSPEITPKISKRLSFVNSLVEVGRYFPMPLVSEGILMFFSWVILLLLRASF